MQHFSQLSVGEIMKKTFPRDYFRRNFLIKYTLNISLMISKASTDFIFHVLVAKSEVLLQKLLKYLWRKSAHKGFLFMTAWQERKKGTESEFELRKMLAVSALWVFSQWKLCSTRKSSQREGENRLNVLILNGIYTCSGARKKKDSMLLLSGRPFYDEIVR